MGITDKIGGRVKQVAGDLLNNPRLRRRGRQQARKAEAKDELAETQRKADAKAEEISNLERKST